MHIRLLSSPADKTFYYCNNLHFLNGCHLGNWGKWSQLCLSGQGIQLQERISHKISSLRNGQWFVLLFLCCTRSIVYMRLYYCYLLFFFGWSKVSYKSHGIWTPGWHGVWGAISAFISSLPPGHPTCVFQIHLSRGQPLPSDLFRALKRIIPIPFAWLLKSPVM